MPHTSAAHYYALVAENALGGKRKSDLKTRETSTRGVEVWKKGGTAMGLINYAINFALNFAQGVHFSWGL